MGFFDVINKMIKDYKENNKVTIKCSNCGANILGNSTERSLKCEYCGTYTNNDKYTPIINNPIKGFNKKNDDSADYDGDFDDDYDESVFFDSKNDAIVYAWIEKGGLFFSGEIPGIDGSKVTLCDSYSECLDKLKTKYYEEKSSVFYKNPGQNISRIKEEHPKAKIIVISQ